MGNFVAGCTENLCAERHNVHIDSGWLSPVNNSALLGNDLLLLIYHDETVHVNPLEKCLLNNSQLLLPELAFCIFPLAIFSNFIYI